MFAFALANDTPMKESSTPKKTFVVQYQQHIHCADHILFYIHPRIMASKQSHTHTTTLVVLLTSYVICGVLHELSHLIVASCLLSSSSSTTTNNNNTTYSVIDILEAVVRAVLGRYSLIQVSEEQQQQQGDGIEYYDRARSIITHAGWMFSVILAVGCHALHIAARNSTFSMQLLNNGKGGVFNTRSVMKVFLNPAIPIVAYITALEAIVTDLFGFTPIQYLDDKTDFICFCGNFGILLLNPSWLSIDGGRTALDVLEKMINVTMMRGMCILYICVSTFSYGVYLIPCHGMFIYTI